MISYKLANDPDNSPIYMSDRLVVARGCFCSNPCKHIVNYHGDRTRMNAKEIVETIQEEGGEIPDHFRYILLKIQKETWMNKAEAGDIDEIVSDEMYGENSQSMKDQAIRVGRLDLIERIHADHPHTAHDFVNAAASSNLATMKGMIGHIKGDSSVLVIKPDDKEHGSPTVLGTCASLGNLEMLRYLIDDVGVPTTGRELFRVKTPLSLSTPVVEYLIEDMIKNNHVVSHPSDRLRVIKDGQEDKFVTNGLLKELPYNITSEYPGSTPIFHENDPTLVVSRRYPGSLLDQPHLFDLERICNLDISKCKNNDCPDYPMVLYMHQMSRHKVRGFEISFEFSDPDIEIAEYVLTSDHLVLYVADVSNNAVKFEPDEPFYNGSCDLDYCNVALRFKTKPIKEAHVTNIHLVADLIGMSSDCAEISFQLSDQYVVQVKSGRFSRLDSTPRFEALTDIEISPSLHICPKHMTQDEYVELLASQIQEKRDKEKGG